MTYSQVRVLHFQTQDNNGKLNICLIQLILNKHANY